MDSVIYCLLIIKYLLPVVLSNEVCDQQTSYVLKAVPEQCRSGNSVIISYTDVNIDADIFKDCKHTGIEQLCITKTNVSSTINDTLFQHLRQLKYLDLSDNEISNLTFLNLTSLKRFDISINNLNILHYDSFSYMHYLRVLDLTKNVINYLSENIFCNNKDLEELYLAANNIDILPERLFSNLRRLWKLILNKNRIREIGQRLFSNMDSISILDLSFNLITVLEAGTFDSNTNLTELYLNDNRITMLPDGLFNKLENLKIIHLERNQLTYIGLNVFPESRTLTNISLHRNQLKYFNASVLKLDGLKSIKLYNNSWVCDCQLKALFEFSKGIVDQSTTCEMPKKLSGKHWIYLTGENFICTSETNNICMHIREKTIYSYKTNVSNEFCQGDNETVIGHFVTSKGHRYTLQFDISKDDASSSHLTLEHTNTNTSESQCMNSVWIAIVTVTLAILVTEIFIFILIKLKEKSREYSGGIVQSTEENVHIYAKPVCIILPI